MFNSLISRSRNNRGAFLIEALIAISILGVSLVFIIQSYLSSLRGALFTENYTLAMFLLENKVSEFKIGETRESEKEKSFPPPYERFVYKGETADVSEDGKPSILEETRLAVHWSSGKKENKLETTTYFFKP